MPVKHTPTGNPSQDALNSAYHYRPTEWICILYVTLFALSTLTHLGQALRSRRWYLIPTLVAGGVGEIIGWSARLWSSINILAVNGFLMQISTLIFSPTFITAANFILLGIIVNRVGSQYGRISPRNYGVIFLTADVVALIIQAVGGSVAASADTLSAANNGGNIMLGGIIIQLVAIVLYSILAGDFFYHVLANKPVRAVRNRKDEEKNGSTVLSSDHDSQGYPNTATVITGRMKLMILGLGLSTLFLFIRSIYRTIELSNGWNGRIIGTQHYFNILDGGMVFLALFTINVLHPTYLLR